jgi:hypothetical protein
VQSICVYHDNTGPGASWHLTQVEINDAAASMSHFFSCGWWFSTEDDDGKIDRKLPLKSKRRKVPKHLKPTTGQPETVQTAYVAHAQQAGYS